jgi:mRNA-degrading endonuclease RelE of RelBE toxin-antitoxin system
VNFLIADTFTESLARLTGDEQKAVKTTAFDLQLNAASPGMSFHKLDKARDKNFWSVRVSRDIRLIVHKTDASLLLCYVDHHDNAYRWAGEVDVFEQLEHFEVVVLAFRAPERDHRVERRKAWRRIAVGIGVSNGPGACRGARRCGGHPQPAEPGVRR